MQGASAEGQREKRERKETERKDSGDRLAEEREQGRHSGSQTLTRSKAWFPKDQAGGVRYPQCRLGTERAELWAQTADSIQGGDRSWLDTPVPPASTQSPPGCRPFQMASSGRSP